MVIFGYVSAVVVHKSSVHQKKFQKSVSVRSGNFGNQNKYTNPLLECEQSEASFTELTPFKEKLESVAKEMESRDGVSAVSVYFRDLNNGPWFGLDEGTSFSPASLLKLPLAIAYYKLAESSQGYLQKKILYDGPKASWPDVTQTIAPKESLVVGQEYTYEELIRRMLSYSDNIAYYLLYSNIPFSDLESVYNDFEIKLNGPGVVDDSIVTVQNYSSFFRILYNASYISKEGSEKILSYLIGSDYQEGLVAGVPQGVEVAHKFGEREVKGAPVKQIHDCGIIYHPDHPYLLCVMTKGDDVTMQSKVIAEISSLVYKEVDSQKNSKN